MVWLSSPSEQRIQGVAGPVVRISSALSAVSALIAVTVAFDGYIHRGCCFALSLVTAVAGRNSSVVRSAAIGFAFLRCAADARLRRCRRCSPRPCCHVDGDAVLAASLLLVACAIAIAWSAQVADEAQRSLWWGIAGRGVELRGDHFTSSQGVLVAGVDGGFLAGHPQVGQHLLDRHGGRVVRRCAAQAPRGPNGPHRRRSGPDRGRDRPSSSSSTSEHWAALFRVAAFIVVGLVLLGMGAGYARSLVQQDRSRPA